MFREQLSPRQFRCLTIGFILGTSLFYTSTGPAGRDSWLSILLAMVWGEATLLLWLSIAERFPGEVPAVWFRKCLGRFVGTFFAVVYVAYSFVLMVLVSRNVADAYLVEVFANTPGIVLTSTFSIVYALTFRAGAEPFARVTQIVVPLTVLTAVVIFALLLATPGLVRIERLFPVLEKGWKDVLRGAFVNYSFPWGETAALVSLYAYIPKTTRPKKEFAAASAFAGLLLALNIAMITSVIGEKGLSQVSFPVLTTVQQVSIGDFIERVDVLVLYSLTFGAFVKCSICMFTVLDNLKVLLNLQDSKTIALPMALLVSMLSIVIYSNPAEIQSFINGVWPVFCIPWQVIIPLATGIALLARKS